MSNFNYRSQFNFSFSAKPVVLRMQVSFGSSGAPTISSGGMGISSITRNSAGDYTILLSKKFANLMMLNSMMISSSAPAAPELRVKADAVASAGSLEIVFSAAGVATDPASGEKVLLEIVLNDSSLSY
jgi:hypothetical protein